MGKHLSRVGSMALGGTLVITGPALVGCELGPTYDDWAATEGALGRINLDAVITAFESSTNAAAFEQRVNQIYEGDGLVLIRVSQEDERRVLEGFEDLNGDGQIDPARDDLLFSITSEREGSHNLQGHGANSYYARPFGGGDFLFGYMIGSMFSRPYSYSTNPSSARGRLTQQRTSYRSSGTYTGQRSTNSSFFGGQAATRSSSYASSATRLSPSRTSYRASALGSGSFRTSSVSRSSGGMGGKGSATGGGGSQVLIGSPRHRF